MTQNKYLFPKKIESTSIELFHGPSFSIWASFYSAFTAQKRPKGFQNSFNIIKASSAVVAAPSQGSPMYIASHVKLQGDLNGTTGKD